VQTLRQTVFGAIVKQEIAFFDKNKTGELVNRLSADTSLVSQSVTMNISDGLRSTVMVVAGVSMMVSRIELVSMYGCLYQQNRKRNTFKSTLTEFSYSRVLTIKDK
jgi:ATP-binding cassette subfamily B (MDR/TAP) protein 10